MDDYPALLVTQKVLVIPCTTRPILFLTGLAVAVAFHAGLFNIGGEGQAYIGGLGRRLDVHELR